MEALEPNMYVRTKNGCIFQILRTTYSKYLSRNKELCYEVDRPINVNMELYDEDISKASHNIIDLIEVGDYVNGEKVGYIDDYDGAMIEYYYDYEDINVGVGHFFEEIKSIVTKEQFESISYEVK